MMAAKKPESPATGALTQEPVVAQRQPEMVAALG
jgi:hypothetical protein